MEQSQETATSYYNHSRKRSFFFSRLIVIFSMLILVIALGINITVLYSEERTSATTRASAGDSQSNLPALPKGCEYQSKEKGVIVVCPTATPELSPTLAANPKFPISVELPELPAPCDYEASGDGLAVTCTSAAAVIPTVPVRTLTSCIAGTEKDTLICHEASNEKVLVPLPPLPKGCEYQLVAKNYFISCKASSTEVQN
ncbi:MAG: hypothetical protein H0W89_03420 [Candidatus Levybacteria bacterium]|nr:hypothetical protein [Candidatus Levybacteria bacterium]